MTDAHCQYNLICGSETVFVLVHGILGSPRQFRFLAEALHQEGYDCMSVLLPGHGNSIASFGRTKPGDWYRHLEITLQRLAKEYKYVYLIGHSLGGLLSLTYAAAHPVTGVVTINSPLSFRLGFRQLSFSVRILCTASRHDDAITAAYREGNSVSGGNFIHYLLWPGQLAELLRIASRTKRLLPNITTNVLIVQSLKDESVGKKSAAKLTKGLYRAATHTASLPNSHHAYFPQPDKDKLIALVLEFVQYE